MLHHQHSMSISTSQQRDTNSKIKWFGATNTAKHLGDRAFDDVEDEDNADDKEENEGDKGEGLPQVPVRNMPPTQPPQHIQSRLKPVVMLSPESDEELSHLDEINVDVLDRDIRIRNYEGRRDKERINKKNPHAGKLPWSTTRFVGVPQVFASKPEHFFSSKRTGHENTCHQSEFTTHARVDRPTNKREKKGVVPPFHVIVVTKSNRSRGHAKRKPATTEKRETKLFFSSGPFTAHRVLVVRLLATLPILLSLLATPVVTCSSGDGVGSQCSCSPGVGVGPGSLPCSSNIRESVSATTLSFPGIRSKGHLSSVNCSNPNPCRVGLITGGLIGPGDWYRDRRTWSYLLCSLVLECVAPTDDSDIESLYPQGVLMTVQTTSDLPGTTPLTPQNTVTIASPEVRSVIKFFLCVIQMLDTQHVPSARNSLLEAENIKVHLHRMPKLHDEDEDLEKKDFG
uniref:Uncharacterized protein n=1 Tax=Timema poppense TaxID=170557 RepID=A0A7R9CY55_TIMPO|nr:unnamed protein product [Timema poppensis]